jgi:hypothetical protein
MLRRLLPLAVPLLAVSIAACQSGAPTAPTPTPSAPPWPAPSDAAAAIAAAGLEALPSESLAYHIHTHLDVFYNGQPVEVPAYLGIDYPGGRFISPLHTHSNTGMLHVEAAQKKVFTLGQLFKEWGVPLASGKAYLNGQLQADPQAVPLNNAEEIAVVFGTPPSAVPSSFAGPWPDSTEPMPSPSASAK